MLKRPIAVLVTLLGVTAQLFAYDLEPLARYHRPAPGEQLLLQDAQDGSLDDHSLIDAALLAAGHAGPAHAGTGAIYGHQLQCRALVEQYPKAVDRARALLHYLHDEIFIGTYEEESFDVGQSLRLGTFNCLTATLIYQALGESIGLDVHAIAEPAHVRCLLIDGESERYVIETTARNWEVAASQASFAHDFTRRLSEAQLVAKIYFNRGVVAMREQRFADAVCHSISSLWLDREDVDARNNVRACLNNWAANAMEAGELKTAKNLLRDGLKVDPHFSPFQQNYLLLP